MRNLSLQQVVIKMSVRMVAFRHIADIDWISHRVRCPRTYLWANQQTLINCISVEYCAAHSSFAPLSTRVPSRNFRVASCARLSIVFSPLATPAAPTMLARLAVAISSKNSWDYRFG